MTSEKTNELRKLAESRIVAATSYLNQSNFIGQIRKSLNEESEIPGFEDKTVKFGSFQKRDFVVLMTDIRKSTDIINSDGGPGKMFVIFYAYSAIVAKIVDSYNGTATEFLGDGVLNLFDALDNRDQALKNSFCAGQEILEAVSSILNPLFRQNHLPEIAIGIGIDIGETIVTRFGHKSDNDLKAFGKCVYAVSRLCKGENSILVSDTARYVWPTAPNGRLQFQPIFIENNRLAHQAYVV